jgi:DHA1 family tetracycline resistance protein-like MFS transporter
MTPSGAPRRAILFIFITVLVDSIGFGVIIPVLPSLLRELTGASLSAAAVFSGWMMFAFAAAQFLCAPVLGGLSDRFGRRPVILSCLLAFGIDYTIMGLTRRVGLLFLGRAIAGIAGASYTPAYAAVADITPPEKRAQNFGIIGAAFGFGFICGPALGGLLGSLGTRVPFLTAAALAFANLTFGYFALPETHPPAARRAFEWSRAHPLGTLRRMRRFPAVIGFAVAVFLWQMAHQVLPSTWAFYTMLRFGWSELMVGASLAFAGVVMAIGQGLLTRVLIPRLGGERRAALIGLLFGMATYVGYATAPYGWMIFPIILLWFPASLVYPSINALMSSLIPADSQGELMGGVASLASLSAIVGPPIMTHTFEWFTGERSPLPFPGASFALSAVLVLASLLLFLRASRLHPQPRTVPLPGRPEPAAG